MPESQTAEFRAQLETLRPYLVRYAALQLRDAEAAQDAVQETLLAALEGQARFAGRSNLRTWLTGILKHKIVDSIRRSSREPSATSLAPAGDQPDGFEALFDSRGHWVEFPADWSDPDASLEQTQFFKVLEDCLAKLPEKTARAFMMREHLGMESAEICKELGLTSTHFWVLLYRARMALRLCLQTNWFEAAKAAQAR
jgi:RNA polymerase sigma-70 factor (ECF subfamily)